MQIIGMKIIRRLRIHIFTILLLVLAYNVIDPRKKARETKRNQGRDPQPRIDPELLRHADNIDRDQESINYPPQKTRFFQRSGIGERGESLNNKGDASREQGEEGVQAASLEKHNHNESLLRLAQQIPLPRNGDGEDHLSLRDSSKAPVRGLGVNSDTRGQDDDISQKDGRHVIQKPLDQPQRHRNRRYTNQLYTSTTSPSNDEGGSFKSGIRLLERQKINGDQKDSGHINSQQEQQQPQDNLQQNILNQPSNNTAILIHQDNKGGNTSRDLKIQDPLVVNDIFGETKDIVNPHNFGYIINNESLCTSAANLEYVVYIHMAPSRSDTRARIRETWGQNNLFIKYPSRLIFFMGDPQDEAVQQRLWYESKKYGDIIQEDFRDHYRNLTYKAIGALKWIGTYCKNAKYVIKADDDVYVNIFLLMAELHGKLANETRFMYCAVWQEGTMAILRDPKKCSKWCINPNQLKGRTTYPTYCSGSAYFFTQNLCQPMYKASLHSHYFYIDDVYITGILPMKIPNFKFIDANPNRWQLLGSPDSFKDKTSQQEVMVSHQNDIRILWYNHIRRLNKTAIDMIGQNKYQDILSKDPYHEADSFNG